MGMPVLACILGRAQSGLTENLFLYASHVLVLEERRQWSKNSNQALLMIRMSRGCGSQKIPKIYFDDAEESPEEVKKLAHDDQRLSAVLQTS